PATAALHPCPTRRSSDLPDGRMSSDIIETAVVAFTAFFATIGPLDVAAIFAALTSTATRSARRRMAVRGTLIATAILVAAALFGEPLLDMLGVSLAALRTAGGVLQIGRAARRGGV